jgi:hypothetical protein
MFEKMALLSVISTSTRVSGPDNAKIHAFHATPKTATSTSETQTSSKHKTETQSTHSSGIATTFEAVSWQANFRRHGHHEGGESSGCTD